MLLPSWSIVQGTFPTTVEVDLIFPRNTTYAPSVLMPIVFAIQNSQLAAPLDFNFQWDISPLGVYNGSSSESGILDLTWANFSGSTLYFAHAATSVLNVEKAWMFGWSLSSGNCSGSSGIESSLGGNNQHNFIEFVTRNGAQQPDLVAATTDDTCSNTESYIFNVTGTLEVDPSRYDGRNSCAVVAPMWTSAANPCGARLDASAASSISAAMTHTACAALHPVVSCPTATSAACREAQFLRRESTFLVAAFGWLAYVFML